MSQTYPHPVFSDEFAGKHVLVTGGTKGIGEAIVERFRIAGALVATTARAAPAHPKKGVLFVRIPKRAFSSSKLTSARWRALETSMRPSGVNGVASIF